MMFIKDDEFIRGNCPMTKEEIRMISISKMNLKEDSFVLDIGSGTGTISVQASKIARFGKVLAIEKDDEAYQVTKSNIEKFNCNNIKVVNEEATKTLTMLIGQKVRFNSIFIGGSGGDLEEIIFNANNLLRDDGTIVMNFITLDNAYKAIEKIESLKYKVEISLVNISKNREGTFMMMANNPIYIIECKKRKEE
ncbi:precorrin-6Y C5,15-methyltransferase (decarboxylating) subunit CbiT [Clostridium uliginosum]|uniref:Cobalt-precorrin-6B (C15)-methyltransferase n=1 Tax=Clostridium uliginosum TaxID=119641 RepID=A0A1I1NWU0_9CLOT|nr:precorrin-6Y C5,15-methyltransferase (decarboxylating) subunit CbiT [Clostridium uliginosum]SFD02027.1 cobalt-precorrin-6B (C15)-methyltransferase [Clostridium uliginosum]